VDAGAEPLAQQDRLGRGGQRADDVGLAGRARVIPYALTVRARNARLLALLD
jgi:ribosome modulation factor